MVLDAVLSDPTYVWLGTSGDKVWYFTRTLGDRVRLDEFPRLTFGAGAAKVVRYFPDKLPIGVQPYAPPHVLIYLVTRPSPVDFRAFLIRHAFLLSRFYQWTIRLLFPRPLTRAIPAYQQAAREHLAFRLSPSSANELKWFFRERQRCQSLLPGAADRRFRDAAKTFNAPRFAALYRAWLTDGDTALWTADSVALPDAVERGEGHIECTVLARQYLHLAPLVGIA